MSLSDKACDATQEESSRTATEVREELERAAAREKALTAQREALEEEKRALEVSLAHIAS